MKEYKTIKEHSNKILNIVNKMKLLGKEFPNFRRWRKNSYNNDINNQLLY